MGITPTMNHTELDICYISSNYPAGEYGSSVVIARHLRKFKKVTICSPQPVKTDNMVRPWKLIPLPKGTLITKILYRWIKINKLFGLQIQFQKKPDIIINVFGKNTVLAAQTAKKYNIPLCIIVHDQWEIWKKTGWDIALNDSSMRSILANAQLRLYASSHIKKHYRDPKGIVLYPIPQEYTHMGKWKSSHKRHNIIYCGQLRKNHIPILKMMAKTIGNTGKITIISDRNSDYSTFKKTHNIEVLGSISTTNDLLNYMVNHATAAIVIQDNDIGFPSRFIQLTQTGMPIIIYATKNTPLYSFSKEHSLSLHCYDKLSLYSTLHKFQSKRHWEKYADEIRTLQDTTFNPTIIHAQLHKMIKTTIQNFKK